MPPETLVQTPPCSGDPNPDRVDANGGSDASRWAVTEPLELPIDGNGSTPARQRFDRNVAVALWEQGSGRRRHVVMVLRVRHSPGAGRVLHASERHAIVANLRRSFTSANAALSFIDADAVALLAPVGDAETPGLVALRALESLKPVWRAHAGLAEPHIDGADTEQLLRAALHASALATEGDFDAPRYIDARRDASDARERRIIRDLALALPLGQLRIVYQPVVSLDTGQMTGLEALLRWRHPVLGEVAPAEFIGHLERTTEIRDVTAWVVTVALGHVERWSRRLGRALRVSVNVPAELLVDDHFVVFALAQLARLQLMPAQLEIELTERSLARNDRPTAARLAELRSHGASVAIDDFGTGCGSLTYLNQLPVDRLKIDVRFSRGATRNPTDAAICRMTAELARGLGLGCVAEGIETPEQLEFFRRLGCEEGQGYLFARPLETEAVDAAVAEAADLALLHPMPPLADEGSRTGASWPTMPPASAPARSNPASGDIPASPKAMP